ncbi:unnamed protein product [marine sediment metagenome]|uniref:Uncharacterized protein n=1 Tax=marine sediment metagenome TaxID=412755 RepID=X1ITV9_9ZZZZ
MPDPDDFRFQVRTPKGPGVRVGEEFRLTLTPQSELQFRIQALERAILRVPILGQDYAHELQRVGLDKLNLELPEELGISI